MPLDSQRRLSRLVAIFATIGVIACNIVVVLLLFPRGRQMNATGIPADVVVIWLPAILAYVAFILLLRATRVRRMPPWVGAFLLTILSLLLSLLLPFNIYGSG